MPPLSWRLRTQLGLWELPFSDAVADNFIGEIALIGSDFYLADGAGAGILLQAKNAALPLALQGLAATNRSEMTAVDLSQVDHPWGRGEPIDEPRSSCSIVPCGSLAVASRYQFRIAGASVPSPAEHQGLAGE